MRPLTGTHIPKTEKSKNMMVIELKRTLSGMLYLFALAALFVGCTREETDPCPVPPEPPIIVRHYTLKVTAYGEQATGGTLNPEEIEDVTLFVFDEDSCFLHKVETTAGRTVMIEGPVDSTLHVVAWGNLRDEGHSYAEPRRGDRLTDCHVVLKPRTRAATPAHSPGDLFRGHLVLEGDDAADRVLPIYREVGSMSITVRRVGAYTGIVDHSFFVTVRETFSWLCFDGCLVGDRISYHPEGSFTSKSNADEYVIPAFRLFPESGIAIDLYQGTTRVATISSDSEGKPIAIEKNRLTEVEIDLGASLEVSVTLTDWKKNQGEIEIEV